MHLSTQQKNLGLALVFLSTLVWFSSSLLAKTTIKTSIIDSNSQEIIINLSIGPDDFVYKDFIDFSVDSADVTLSAWHSDTPTHDYFEPTSQEKKKVYKNDLTIKLLATRQQPTVEKATAHFSYYLHSKKGMVEEMLPLSFVESKKEVSPAPAPAQESALSDQKDGEQSVKKIVPATKKVSWSAYLSNLITASDSIWIRLLLVLLLGLLMSLTPCIYPMIPITMGILQANHSSSVTKNFILSLCYTLGIATTFALLGLLAAFTGQIFGQILMQPLVIIPLVAMLTYLALAMMGLYEMHIPRFLLKPIKTKGGSYISAFIFGAASGTVASPCLSPGLVLLLSLVTTLGSKFLGFILLFTFGVGLSFPLIIIGTFSSSLHFLPQSGMWMVEIKKLFGFILLATNFYFLNNIMPTTYLLWLMAATTFAAGVLYLRDLKPHDAQVWKHIKNFVGIGLVSSSVFIGIKAYEYGYIEKLKENYGSYKAARQHAIKEKKRLFLDIGGPFCSICKKIDKEILMQPEVLAELKKFISIKVDADHTNETYQQILEQFPVRGVPTILIIDPVEEKELQRWGAELIDKPIPELIDELKKLAHT